MMTVTIESDLKEVLAKFEQKLGSLSKEVSEIRQNDLVALKVGQVPIEEKVDGLSKSMDNQEFLSRGILIGLARSAPGRVS